VGDGIRRGPGSLSLFFSSSSSLSLPADYACLRRKISITLRGCFMSAFWPSCVQPVGSRRGRASNLGVWRRLWVPGPGRMGLCVPRHRGCGVVQKTFVGLLV
jgi:hypothetical protein